MKTMNELIREANEKGFDVIIIDSDGFYIEKSYNDDYWVTMADAYCVMCEYTTAEVEAMEVASYDYCEGDGVLFIEAK